MTLKEALPMRTRQMSRLWPGLLTGAAAGAAGTTRGAIRCRVWDWMKTL
jgi:hypothetical protein